jgi:hypothetical protein
MACYRDSFAFFVFVTITYLFACHVIITICSETDPFRAPSLLGNVTFLLAVGQE